MSTAALVGFEAHVLADPGLQAELLAVGDRTAFVALVVERAKDRGFTVGPDDVEQALRDRRQAWRARWL